MMYADYLFLEVHDCVVFFTILLVLVLMPMLVLVQLLVVLGTRVLH